MWLVSAGAAAAVVLLGAMFLVNSGLTVRAEPAAGLERIKLSEAEWQERLTPEQFQVLRKEGTEAAWSSPLNDETRAGVFVCAGCDLELFPSRYKFKSGTGWPSFYDVIQGHVETKTDYALVIPRTEYHCARCGGHQGHVFRDGPAPTGLRYCNNGVALKFVAAKDGS